MEAAQAKGTRVGGSSVSTSRAPSRRESECHAGFAAVASTSQRTARPRGPVAHRAKRREGDCCQKQDSSVPDFLAYTTSKPSDSSQAPRNSRFGSLSARLHDFSERTPG